MGGLDRGLMLGVTSLALYVVGGVATFAGLVMVVALKGQDLMGLGDGSSMGYLLVCVGLCLSITGVLLMRVLRNRRLA